MKTPLTSTMLMALACAALSLTVLETSAVAQGIPKVVPAQDRSIGLSEQSLLSERGKPTAIVDGTTGHRTLEYKADGCTTTYSVFRGLVMNGTGMGPLCKTAFNDLESMEISQVPGFARYDGPSGVMVVATRAATRLAQKDYAGLDRLFSELKNPQLRLNDGRGMAMGLEYTISVSRSSLDSAAIHERLRSWRAQDPRSVAAAVLESAYWRAAAWEARGSGYASSVTREGWQLFRERMGKAEAALKSVEPFGREHPIWFSEYLEILHSTGRPKKELLEFFEQARSKYPDHLPFYFTVVETLTPKWGGDYRLVALFVRDQQRRLPPGEAAVLYTRAYWSLQQTEGLDFDIYRDAAADWKEMKKGFVLMAAANPLSLWNANNYAAFACRAYDREAYRAARSQFGEYVMPAAWPSNLSTDICDRRFSGLDATVPKTNRGEGAREAIAPPVTSRASPRI